MWTVYRHVAPNGKMYIGITSRKPEKRWGTDGKGYKNHKFFWNAIQKYGWDNILHEILTEVNDEKVAKMLEQWFIFIYKSNDRKYGYNMTKGGDGHNIDENTKNKLSESHKGITPWMKGKRHTIKTRKQMSESAKKRPCNRKGQHQPEEAKLKQSAKIKGRHWYNNGIIQKLTYKCPEGFQRGKLK